MSKKDTLPFLNVAQAAIQMGISQRWVTELINNTVIRAKRIDDGPWLIPKAEVARFLKRKVPAQGAHRVNAPA